MDREHGRSGRDDAADDDAADDDAADDDAADDDAADDDAADSDAADDELEDRPRLRMEAFDLPTVLRCARRYAHLSQREVSRAAGVDRRTIERLESGAASDVTVSMLLRLLRAAKTRLQLVTVDGTPIGDLHPDASEWLDGAGRHQPAHLFSWRVRNDMGLAGWPNRGYFYNYPTRTFENRAATEARLEGLRQKYREDDAGGFAPPG